MSGIAEPDLTGRWIGIFNYPELLPPNRFEATLRDIGGLITGLTSEKDDDPDGPGGTLHAMIEGRRKGSALSFTKMYDDLQRAPDVIFYSGTVQPDGNEIEGRWAILGDWSGTFLMIRTSKASEAAERKVAETIAIR